MKAISHCRNPKCRDRLALYSDHWFCPSCRAAGKYGIFIGGLAVGAIAALIKLIS